jgi:uncharacterized protein YcfJ
MKYVTIPFIAAGLAGACSAALATEYGTVVSSTPVTAQVAVPQRQCSDQPVLVQPPNTGGGALLGAIVGGVVGNNVGGGFGRAAATGLGIVAGSAIGDRVEAAGNPPVETTVRNCQTLMSYENRVVGYDVVYEYNGQRYSTRMAQDPGARIALNVAVSPASGGVIAPATPIAAYPPAAVTAYPAQPVYVPYPSYGPYGYYAYGGPVVALAPRVVIGVGGGYYRHHGY